MEGSVRDRFRLIYLKSTDSERGNSKRSSLSSDSKHVDGPNTSWSGGASDVYSIRARLEQAKADLKHPDPKIRILALRYLEKEEASSSAASLLQNALSDPNAEVRAQAILALARFKGPETNLLLKKHLRDGSPDVKMAALRGIFQSGQGVDLNILLQLLSDESPWVRRKMATLLGWFPMEGVLPILAQLSADPEARVRKAALLSLISLYPDERKERLLKSMADPDPGLRRWAKKALERTIEKTNPER